MIIASLGDVEDTVYAMDEGRLDHLEQVIRNARKSRLEARFPLSTKIIIHRDDEVAFEQGERLKLNDAQMEAFRYTGYEVELDVLVQEDGTALATHINGVKITEPVSI